MVKGSKKKRGPGRPPMPRDRDGNIIRDGRPKVKIASRPGGVLVKRRRNTRARQEAAQVERLAVRKPASRVVGGSVLRKANKPSRRTRREPAGKRNHATPVPLVRIAANLTSLSFNKPAVDYLNQGGKQSASHVIFHNLGNGSVLLEPVYGGVRKIALFKYLRDDRALLRASVFSLSSVANSLVCRVPAWLQKRAEKRLKGSTMSFVGWKVSDHPLGFPSLYVTFIAGEQMPDVKLGVVVEGTKMKAETALSTATPKWSDVLNRDEDAHEAKTTAPARPVAPPVPPAPVKPPVVKVQPKPVVSDEEDGEGDDEWNDAPPTSKKSTPVVEDDSGDLAPEEVSASDEEEVPAPEESVSEDEGDGSEDPDEEKLDAGFEEDDKDDDDQDVEIEDAVPVGVGVPVRKIVSTIPRSPVST